MFHAQPLFYAQILNKYCIKLPSGYIYKGYMKHKLILCFDLGLIPQISCYVHANILNYRKISYLLLKSFKGFFGGEVGVFATLPKQKQPKCYQEVIKPSNPVRIL